MNVSLEDLEKRINEEKALLIYFYTDACAPCFSLRPKVEKLLNNGYPEMKSIMIDSEANPLVTAHFMVFSAPTLLIYFEGREHARFSKFVSIEQLSETIDRSYRLLFG
jgi:thioredoxin 1